MSAVTGRPFAYHDGVLCAGGVALDRLSRRYGTPLYVYDLEEIRGAYAAYQTAFAAVPHRLCAAVKANANLTLLRHLARWGSGFDVVSGGELERVLHAGGQADRIVFSGVGKTAAEMDAALRAGILLFNVESEPELELLASRAARLRVQARYGLRVNPDIAAATHPHIATGLRQHKFGVSLDEARKLYAGYQSRWLRPSGISCHIGSQILDAAPFAEAARRLAGLVGELERRHNGLHLRFVDLGGGLGIRYRPGQRPPSLRRYAAAVLAGLRQAGLEQGRELLLEPGRSLFAAAGALLTQVLYVKSAARRFVITDAGSNDLMRPSLYDAYHEIVAVRPRAGRRRGVDIVGPICESGDSFARDRPLTPVAAGDVLAILDAGAYGFTLSSNYNARPRAAEVVIAGGRAHLARRREAVADLWAAEV